MLANNLKILNKIGTKYYAALSEEYGVGMHTELHGIRIITKVLP